MLNWRGVKRDGWEGGHRVPFIARWPGRIAAGRTSDALIGHVRFNGDAGEFDQIQIAGICRAG